MWESSMRALTARYFAFNYYLLSHGCHTFAHIAGVLVPPPQTPLARHQYVTRLRIVVEIRVWMLVTLILRACIAPCRNFRMLESLAENIFGRIKYFEQTGIKTFTEIIYNKLIKTIYAYCHEFCANIEAEAKVHWKLSFSEPEIIH